MTLAPRGQSFALVSASYLERVVDCYAANLEELRLGIEQAPPEVLFLHTQLPRLAPEHGSGTPIDDFSQWVGTVVMDAETAERMAFGVQSCAPNMTSLRAALLAPLERLTGQRRQERSAPAGAEFVFLAADGVALPAGIEAAEPEDLFDALTRADPSIWFHHLIEQEWLPADTPLLMKWLEGHGADRIAGLLRSEAETGQSIRIIRDRIVRRWRRRQLGRRLKAGRSKP